MVRLKVPLLCLGLLLLVALTFLPLLDAGFVAYDDDLYVTANPPVLAGPSMKSLRWSFADVGYAANWHPLTWISHMLDVQFFGSDPRGHHLVSILLHGANTVLLFILLFSLTGTFFRSAVVAALFAVHPLHVESVAWISERKDVLSTFFLLAAMLSYSRCAARPRWAVCIAVFLLFALGLMAKPMVMTFPLLCLLLDFWPLKRLPANLTPGRALLEKIPLFALSAASLAVTWAAQRAGGAFAPESLFPFWTRVANALTAYLWYMGKTILPFRLAAFYPHPGPDLPLWKPALSLAVLAGITIVALRVRDRRPWLAVGWLWYLVALLPVIGLMQVGAQAVADRYTYIPLVGLFIAVVWTVGDWSVTPLRARGLALAAIAVVILSAGLSRRQSAPWKDSGALFSHAVAVTTDNWLMENNLGKVYFDAGRHREAEQHFAAAVRIRPDYVLARYNLGLTLYWQWRLDESIAHFSEAVRIRPDYASAHHRLGRSLYW
ncbi:tetratricopeptide repeat protein, partial [Candidatus Moduliflexota bacterium]